MDLALLLHFIFLLRHIHPDQKYEFSCHSHFLDQTPSMRESIHRLAELGFLHINDKDGLPEPHLSIVLLKDFMEFDNGHKDEEEESPTRSLTCYPSMSTLRILMRLPKR